MAQGRTQLDFSAVDGGLNTVDDALLIEANQVQAGTINAILTKAGAQRCPGQIGIKSTAIFSDYLRGLKSYLQEDGTDLLIGVSGGHIYDINKTTGALADRYTIGTAANEAVQKTFKDKHWICNGAGIVKLENTTAYQVGITKPTGATATAAAGGSLPNGVYKIFLGYYRKVGSSIVLYSEGQSVADVTLSGGNGTIAVSIPDSADAQVGGGVIWMTDAGGSVYYQYATLDGSGAYSFNVADASAKNSALIYEVEALYNQRPANFSYIEFHDNRLWGVDPTTKHRVWYSMKAGTVYDLERFPNAGLQTNYIDYPFQVTGLISLGQHLFINTRGGLIVQPYGDPSVKYEWIDKRYFFSFMNTVDYFGSTVIGVTNDGVRIFDGVQFSPDLTAKIKDIAAKIYSSTDNHGPCAVVKKRNIRTEYHLSFIDTAIGSTNNNRRLVLNLDTLQYIGQASIAASWEEWQNGAEQMAVDSTGKIFCGQSLTSAGTIYVENTDHAHDTYLYSQTGTFLTTATNKTVTIITRSIMPGQEARCKFRIMRILAKLNAPTTFTLTVGGRYGVSGSGSIAQGQGVSRFGTAVFGRSKFASEAVEEYKKGLQQNLNGYYAFITITQTADDIRFQVLKSLVQTEPAIGRFM